jgi:hypothetical protein
MTSVQQTPQLFMIVFVICVLASLEIGQGSCLFRKPKMIRVE